MSEYSLAFPYLHGEPQQTALFKSQPEDFIVDEIFDFQAMGEGEHLFLKVKKTGENTQFLSDQLARFLSINKMDVGFAGMKDRQAITTQWFSLYLPDQQRTLDWQAFLQQSELKAELLEFCRHNKKLRRGDHSGNRFTITLRDIPQTQETEERLSLIKQHGVPNYFGEQRFGREASNLQQFADLLEKNSQQNEATQRTRSKYKRKRNTNSMLVSAARAWLFNCVLSERIKRKTWATQLEGEVLVDGKISGPLWGRGRLASSGEVAEIEVRALENYSAWCNHLEHSGLSQERRQLQLVPRNIAWHWQQDVLTLTFSLASGQYATALLREVCKLK